MWKRQSDRGWSNAIGPLVTPTAQQVWQYPRRRKLKTIIRLCVLYARRLTNLTGSPVTLLRFRVIVITGSPVADTANADLRVRTSSAFEVNNISDDQTCQASGLGDAPCNVSVQGLTLEQPPTQGAGGGINSSLLLESVTEAVTKAPVESGIVYINAKRKSLRTGTVTLSGPLADGDSINVQVLLGVRKLGRFRFLLNVEAVTDASPDPQSPSSAPAGANDPTKPKKRVKPITPVSRPLE